MICLLINYYWVLYLGEKYTYIEINAKEWLENLYYSFISVTGLVGRQQSHLKCLLAGQQHATEARWKPLGSGGQAWSLGRLHKSILPVLLFSQNANFSSLWIPRFKKEPQIQTHAFYRFWTFWRGLMHILDKFAFQIRRGTEKGKTNSQQFVNYNGAWQRGWKHDYWLPPSKACQTSQWS